MKELVALLFGGVLISLGWNQPYRDHYLAAQRTLSGKAAPAVANAPLPPAGPVVSAATPAPRDNSWMWQRGTLDSTKQSGVDRSGVHTVEPRVRNQ